MKKIILIIISLFLFPKDYWAITASSYIAMDMDSKRVIMSSNINKKSLIASTTKIMTAYIALTYGDLGEEIEVGNEIFKAYGSSIYLQVGEKISLEKLIYGLLLRSGNDAAIVIAKNISGDMSSFVNLMNEVAKELKMKNTVFFNAHGLEEQNGIGNTSTVYDMAILTIKAMENAKYREIVQTKKITVKTSLKSYTWYNKNKLLNMYPYTTGGKTGFTKKAKRTLVTTASKENKNIVVVTFNDGNDFSDHKNIYQKIFDNYERYEIVSKEDYKFIDNYYKKGNLYIKDSFYMLMKPNEMSSIKIIEELEKKEHPEDNEKVGNLIVYLDNNEIYRENIYYFDKHQNNIFSRIWAKVKLWLT